MCSSIYKGHSVDNKGNKWSEMAGYLEQFLILLLLFLSACMPSP